MEVNMNLDELIKLKEEIRKKYEEEMEKYNSCISKKDKAIISGELEDILRELIKVDRLISIYQNNNNEEKLIVLLLERLYMQLILGMNQEEYDKLSEDKLFNIFDKYFPDEWVYNDDVKDKEKLLLEAICENRKIDTHGLKKTLSNDWGR